MRFIGNDTIKEIPLTLTIQPDNLSGKCLVIVVRFTLYRNAV